MPSMKASETTIIKKYLTISLELSGFNLLNIYSGKEGSKHNIEPMGPIRG